MSDYILLTGDTVNFDPAFGPAVVAVAPGTLNGSAEASYDGKKICVEGDEKNVMVPGCSYFTSAHSVPGAGTLKIDSLGGDQKAQKTKFGGKPALLKGSKFNAVFEVTAPAQMPPPASTPDPMTRHPGFGSFIATNTTWTGE